MKIPIFPCYIVFDGESLLEDDTPRDGIVFGSREAAEKIRDDHKGPAVVVKIPNMGALEFFFSNALDRA